MIRRSARFGLALLAALATAPALAQLTPPGEEALPLRVDADESIEWHQDQQAYVARGNAVAQRGTLTIAADVLIAYYRERPAGGTEIWRLAAEGDVHIATPTQEAFGDRGVYDLDRKVAVLTGESLRLVTPTDVVTARDSLEYWETERLAVARGNAVATRADSRVRADLLVGLLEDDGTGNLAMRRIDAQGNVVITTPTDVVRGEHGIYDIADNRAVLSGDVRITRGESQLNGARAEVDFDTGVSRLLAGPSGGPTGRVQGLFVPGQEPGAGLPEGRP